MLTTDIWTATALPTAAIMPITGPIPTLPPELEKRSVIQQLVASFVMTVVFLNALLESVDTKLRANGCVGLSSGHRKRLPR
jgi:hypothetical protein